MHFQLLFIEFHEFTHKVLWFFSICSRLQSFLMHQWLSRVLSHLFLWVDSEAIKRDRRSFNSNIIIVDDNDFVSKQLLSVIHIEVLVCKVNETSVVEVLTRFIDALSAMKQLTIKIIDCSEIINSYMCMIKQLIDANDSYCFEQRRLQRIKW